MAKRDQYTTPNGYNSYELMSAIQKDIRRGNERHAVFWALELEAHNQYLLWNRLIIIASEDIGPANNMMAILIDILHRRYLEYHRKKNTAKGLFLVHAVLAMCRSFKSREVDELFCLTAPQQGMGIALPEIPDYALDMHTRKGKAMGRGLQHFYEEGAVIQPTEFKDAEGYPTWHSPYTAEVAAFEQLPAVKEWYRNQKWKPKKKEAKPEKESGSKKLGEYMG